MQKQESTIVKPRAEAAGYIIPKGFAGPKVSAY